VLQNAQQALTFKSMTGETKNPKDITTICDLQGLKIKKIKLQKKLDYL